MTTRVFTIGRAVVAAAVVAAAIWAARLDVPRLTGKIKGDEASYVSMALSLARDGDLVYRPEDYARFRQEFHQGPEGIFLKRMYATHWRFQAGWPPVVVEKTPVSPSTQLAYGKPFAYSAAAAPFVALMGLGGLLFFNVVLLGVSAWCAVRFARARIGPVAGTVLGVAFVALSVVEVYTAWFTPELFNFTLVVVAYFLWLEGRVSPAASTSSWRGLVAAFLLGVVAFSKLTNLLLAGPLLVDALMRRRFRHAAGIGALWIAGSAGLFAINGWISGEWNFQGAANAADRRYFVEHFPYDDAGTSFERSGTSMATNEANDEDLLSPAMLSRVPLNAWYFFVGRDAGLIPYYFPGVVILVWWIVQYRKATPWQVTIFLAFSGSVIGLLVFAPALWNGGGGPVGNRYAVSIYATLLFLLPQGRGLVAAIVAAAVGATSLAPILIHPFNASQATWLNPERWPLRLFPVELTLIENLPVRLNIDRRRIEVSKDPEVFLYYMDGHTGFQEKSGFWILGNATADIVIRTEVPLTRLDMEISSPIDNEVDVSVDGRSTHISLRAGETVTAQLRPDPGVYAYTSYVVLWKIKTSAGFYPRQFDPLSPDTRRLGVFISPKYYVTRKE